jgi:protein-S-isoprenylcysteine O-methyltransferase Ste14
MGINPGEKTELVFSGPFAYVRNPIYGLSQLLMLCAIVVMPNVIMFIAGVIHILFMQWEVRREERNLISVHGDAYRSYLANVGRFIPKSLRPYHTTQQG